MIKRFLYLIIGLIILSVFIFLKTESQEEKVIFLDKEETTIREILLDAKGFEQKFFSNLLISGENIYRIELNLYCPEDMVYVKGQKFTNKDDIQYFWNSLLDEQLLVKQSPTSYRDWFKKEHHSREVYYRYEVGTVIYEESLGIKLDKDIIYFAQFIYPEGRFFDSHDTYYELKPTNEFITYFHQLIKQK